MLTAIPIRSICANKAVAAKDYFAREIISAHLAPKAGEKLLCNILHLRQARDCFAREAVLPDLAVKASEKLPCHILQPMHGRDNFAREATWPHLAPRHRSLCKSSSNNFTANAKGVPQASDPMQELFQELQNRSRAIFQELQSMCKSSSKSKAAAIESSA